MQTQHRDHGSYSDAAALPYAPAPALQVISSASFAGRFVYTCRRELEDARIALDRVSYAAARAKAFDATDEQLQGVKDAARDCELAIAAVIAKLAGAA